MERFTCKKCRYCGAATSVLVTREGNFFFGGSVGWSTAYTNETSKYPCVNGELHLNCRNCTSQIRAHRVRGVFRADKKCDTRCLGAKGHSCECSCGGKNHGASHSLVEI
jgi:hypothetical protein